MGVGGNGVGLSPPPPPLPAPPVSAGLSRGEPARNDPADDRRRGADDRIGGDSPVSGDAIRAHDARGSPGRGRLRAMAGLAAPQRGDADLPADDRPSLHPAGTQRAASGAGGGRLYAMVSATAAPPH